MHLLESWCTLECACETTGQRIGLFAVDVLLWLPREPFHNTTSLSDLWHFEEPGNICVYVGVYLQCELPMSLFRFPSLVCLGYLDFENRDTKRERREKEKREDCSGAPHRNRHDFGTTKASPRAYTMA